MILFKSHTKYGTQKNAYSECMSIIGFYFKASYHFSASGP